MQKEDFKLYHNAWLSRTPPNHSKAISKSDAKELLRSGGWMVRNVYNWDKQESSSFWYVIKDNFGGIDELPSKVRNQVRKSNKTYEFRKVDAHEMADMGYELYNKTRERFNDKSLYKTKEQWKSRCKGDDKQFWIGYHRETGEPHCFAMNKLYDDHCDYVSMGVNPEAPSSTYPMYGLIIEMNRYYLEELKLTYVSDGARSITEHSNIQPFLIEKFKFRIAYCDLQIFYKPWLSLLVKFLYPFRNKMSNKRILAILNQESMTRNN